MAERGVGQYWCHRCEDEVAALADATGEMACVRCNETFVEEMPFESPTNPNDEHAGAGAAAPPMPRIIVLDDGSGRSSVLVLPRGGVDDELGAREGTAAAAAGGAAALPFPFPLGVGGGVIGDYFMGQGLENLLQRLMENDPNRYGSPPAAADAVEALQTIRVSDENARSGDLRCPVCFEDFKVGDETKRMPCNHSFHPDCLLPWLSMHCTCPVCRFRMPTEAEKRACRDSHAQAEAQAQAQAQAQSQANGHGNGNSSSSSVFSTSSSSEQRSSQSSSFSSVNPIQMDVDAAGNGGPRVIRREITFTLPWPMLAPGFSLRRMGPAPDGSDGRSGNGNGNGDSVSGGEPMPD